MSDCFLLFGVASLQLLPIFTLIYLQNELTILLNLFQYLPSKLLSLIAMLLSFSLIFINTLSIGETMRIISTVLLIITLSMSVNYTYKDYTIDEGEERKKICS
jgi:hypothetical protein